jgi:hypothetical protein
MRRLIALALLVVGCSAIGPSTTPAVPTISFITPQPSVTGDACWLVPDLTVLAGRPNPAAYGSDSGGNLTCLWMYGPKPPYDGFALDVDPSDQFDGVKAYYDTKAAPTTVVGLGSEAYYWSGIAVGSEQLSYLLALAPPNTILIEIAVGDRSHDRDIAVAVAQSAIERLPLMPVSSPTPVPTPLAIHGTGNVYSAPFPLAGGIYVASTETVGGCSATLDLTPESGATSYSTARLAPLPTDAAASPAPIVVPADSYVIRATRSTPDCRWSVTLTHV